jgi:hypothetical protein
MAPHVLVHVWHHGIGAVIGSLVAYSAFGSTASDPVLVLVVGGVIGILASTLYRTMREG